MIIFEFYKLLVDREITSIVRGISPLLFLENLAGMSCGYAPISSGN
jgi:hypothetical protein